MPSCKALPLGGTVVLLGSSLERQEVQHMVPNVMLYPPSALAAIATPVTFPAKGGQRWQVALEDGKRKRGIGHIQVATSSSLILRDWASWMFVNSFKPASNLGRPFATVFHSRPNLFQ